MAITIDGLKDTIVGCSELTIKEKTSGRVIVLPKPGGLSIAQNPDQRVISGTDSLGQRTPINNYRKGYNYQMTLTYGQLLPEIIELRLANKFKTVSSRLTTLTRSIYITGTTVAGAPNADTVGYTVAEDEPNCVASVKTGNVSTPLTRVAYSGFDASQTNKFAVGANLQLKFSTNLIGKTVQVFTPYTVTTGFTLSADPLETYEISAVLADTATQAILFNVFDAKVSLEGAAFNPDDEQLQIPFFLFPVAGRELPYEMIYTNEKVLVI